MSNGQPSGAQHLTRYRVGFHGLKRLNGLLEAVGLQARSACFDKQSVGLYCDPTMDSMSHQILPGRPPRPEDLRKRSPAQAAGGSSSAASWAAAACVLVPCFGLEEGKPRPETPLGVAYWELLKRLWDDALVQPASPGHSHPVTRLDRFFRNPMHKADWWKFHYPRNRLFCLETRMGERYARVHHSTLECFRAYFRFLPSLELFNDEPFRAPSPGLNFATLLTQADVLAGRTQSRLETVLEEAATGDFDGILVRTTCVPDMVGDSPLPCLKDLAARKNVAGHWVAKTHPTPNAIALILQRRVHELLARPPSESGRPVVLAGVETQQLADEFASLLAPLGVQVCENLLPNLVLKEGGSGPAPVACIWTNSYGWEELLTDELLPQMPVVRTFPPYGLEATRSWLTRIDQVLGLNGADRIETMTEETLRRLYPIRQAAAAVPVALVGDQADLNVLAGRSPYSGFSVLALLRELGFPVSLLLYQPENAAGPAELAGAQVLPFETQPQLAELLSRHRLAFTDFATDLRLTACGVQGFGAGLLDPGFDGLIRAGLLLLDRARPAPFASFPAQLSSLWRPPA